ncbi:unnamed protein product [Aphanomyces euteiches]|nr:hypothetical protein Ae201684P_013240 [Aphanomyces euteiches]KAH9142862.1 hypothetical protein AeRB84_013094 [Aphanomyces euteiches]
MDQDEETNDNGTRRWWSEEDDVSLLIQVNRELPFKAIKTTRAWEELASSLQRVDGFSRSRLDEPPQVSNNVGKLVWVSQDETEKVRLLDELVQLVDDTESKKESSVNLQQKIEKSEATKFIRDEAMKTCSRKRISSDDQDVEGRTSKKQKLILDVQDKEIELEREKLELKKQKLEWEIKKKEMARDEREKDHQERAEQRLMDQRRNDETMKLIHQLLDKIKHQ